MNHFTILNYKVPNQALNDKSAKMVNNYCKSHKAQKTSEEDTSNAPAERTLQVSLWLRVENNSKFVRGKTKVRQRIEETILSQYDMQKERADGWDYTLTIHYQTDEELERIISDDILREADSMADLRYCFIEADIRALDGSGL